MVKISNWQAVLIYFAVQGASQALTLPPVASSLAQEGSWLSVPVAAFASLPILGVVLILARRFPEEDLLQYGERVLGHFLGKALGLAYVFYFLEIAALEVRRFNIFLTTDLLPQTPPTVILVLLVSLSASAARNGVEVIGRLAELFVPFGFLFMFMVLAVHLSHFRAENLRPWLGAGWGPVLANSLTTLPWLGQVFVLGLIYPVIRDQERSGRYFLLASISWGAFLSLFCMITISTFGAPLTARLTFPGYSLAERVRVGGFLEGMDVLLFVIWVTGVFLEVSLFHLLAAQTLARLLHLRDYQRLVLPVGVLMVVLAQIMAENVAQLQAFLRPAVFVPFTLTFQLLFPLGLLLAAWLRGLKGADRRG